AEHLEPGAEISFGVEQATVALLDVRQSIERCGLADGIAQATEREPFAAELAKRLGCIAGVGQRGARENAGECGGPDISGLALHERRSVERPDGSIQVAAPEQENAQPLAG